MEKLSTKYVIKTFLEAAEYVEPNVKEQIDNIIQTLRDEDFYNEKSRKKFIAHLTNLMVLEDNSDDARKSVRKFFKHISNAITEYEIDIADDSDIIEEKNNEERMRRVRMASESKKIDPKQKLENVLNKAKSYLKETEYWSADVDVKKHPPEGLFANGSAEEIASWAKRTHGDLQSAMAALNHYINRAGENLSSEAKNKVENAKEKLRKMYENRFWVKK